MSRRIVYLMGVALTLALTLLCGALAASAVTIPSDTGVTNQDSPSSWFGPVGLTINRIYEDPSRADVVNFSDVNADSGVVFALPLGPQTDAMTPTLIGAFTTPQTSNADARFVLGRDAQTVGLEFNLLGADSTIELQSTSASFDGNTTSPRIAGPTVFAFYNFPQAARLGSPSGLGFGALQAQALTPGLSAQNAANADESALSSPLVSSLSPQGPFWYGAYAPATRGQTIQLNFPFKLAKIPVKLRFGEQETQQVESSSLATQILGPAFASSANYSSLSGGVTLALPLLTRRATVSLDGLYESLQNQKNPFALTTSAAQPTTLAGAPATVVYYPNLADLQQYVGAASLALPVTKTLTVNGSFSEQLYGGVDLNTLTQSLTQHKTAYGGGVVYNIPKTHSSINLFFNRNIYTDDNAPTYNFTENQQNLYFSVKF